MSAKHNDGGASRRAWAKPVSGRRVRARSARSPRFEGRRVLGDSPSALSASPADPLAPSSFGSPYEAATSALRPDGSIRRRGRRQVAIALLALLLGAACIAYPFVSDWANQNKERHVIETTDELVSGTDEDTLAAEREKAVEYNRQLLDGRAVVTDPFDPDAERPTDEDYDNVMNLAGDGVMGTINIPAIHVELPIYHTVDDDVLEHGVGHLEGTSVPIGGESTHCVLSGHTGLPSMKIFDNLDRLKEGDYFVLSVLGEDHAYEVTSIETVLPDETDSLVIEEGRDLCTLVTCTPYGVNTHRLLVHAERCEVPEEWLDKGDADFPAGYSEPPDKALLPSVLLGLLLAFIVIGGYTGVQRLRKRRAEAAAAAGLASGAGGHSGRGGAGGSGVAAGAAAQSEPGLRPLEGPLPGNPYGRHVGPNEDLAASAAKAGAPVIPTGRDRRGSAGVAAAGASVAATGAGATHAAGTAGTSRPAGTRSHKPSSQSASAAHARPAGKRFKPSSGSASASSADSSQPPAGNHRKNPGSGTSTPRGHHFK